MFMKLFIGIVAVYLVDQADPNLTMHALGLYIVAMCMDTLVFLTEGILWGRK